MSIKQTYQTNIDLSDVLSLKSHDLDIKVNLEDVTYTKPETVVRTQHPDTIVMTEGMAKLQNGNIRLMTVYDGKRIKNQTLILLTSKDWIMYSYSNETGEGLMTDKYRQQKMSPEKGIEGLLRKTETKSN